MTKREQLLACALAELGYVEGRANDTKYGRWYGMNNNPWCMMFISWCAERVGIARESIPKMAYCPYAVSWFQARGRWLPPRQAQAGDLIFFDSNGGGADHVGLVERVEAERVHTVEGNRDNTVKRYSYSLSDGSLLGLGRPLWPQQEQDAPAGSIEIYLSDGGGRVEVNGWVEQGVSYIRLRDVEKLFPVRVGWDEKQRLATLSLNYRQ